MGMISRGSICVSFLENAFPHWQTYPVTVEVSVCVLVIVLAGPLFTVEVTVCVFVIVPAGFVTVEVIVLPGP